MCLFVRSACASFCGLRARADSQRWFLLPPRLSSLGLSICPRFARRRLTGAHAGSCGDKRVRAAAAADAAGTHGGGRARLRGPPPIGAGPRRARRRGAAAAPRRVWGRGRAVGENHGRRRGRRLRGRGRRFARRRRRGQLRVDLGWGRPATPRGSGNVRCVRVEVCASAQWPRSWLYHALCLSLSLLL
jgi:hypothetical protein